MISYPIKPGHSGVLPSQRASSCQLLHRPEIRQLALLVAAGVSLAACGGDDPPSSSMNPNIDASAPITAGSSSVSASRATGGSKTGLNSGSGGNSGNAGNRSTGTGGASSGSVSSIATKGVGGSTASVSNPLGGGATSNGAQATGGSVTAPQAPSSTTDRCNSLSATQIQQYADDIIAFFTQEQASLNVLGTTISPLGTVLDWIDPNTQSPTHQLATMPPLPDLPDLPELTDPVVTSLETGLLDPWLAAHPNLVPIPRIDILSQLTQAWNCMSLQDVLSKYGDANDHSAPPTESGGGEINPDDKWAHHYASTRQYGAVYGSAAVLQVANPSVWRDDEFSLAQVALASQSTGPLQTIEVGWQKSRLKYHDDLPHIFIYYTTNTYHTEGDYLGGYNREVYGWEPVSHKTHPGDAVVLGSQMSVWVHMYAGNWWININGDWMGYYPGSLFDPKGLGNVGDQVSWYGEITDYRLDNATTYTQMGNGQFAGPNSAYISNILFEAINQTFFYTPNAFKQDKPNCYSILTYPNSGTNLGSYLLYGGPGKGSPSCL